MIASADHGIALIGSFLRWWRAELVALVPERVRQLSLGKRYLVLMLDGSGPATVSLETSGRVTALGQIIEPTGAAARVSLQAILQRPEIAKLLASKAVGLCLRLPSRCALCRPIDLPLGAESNLAEVIGFELDRYTPFRAEQVYYCHRILERDIAAQHIKVEVTLVPRATLDEAVVAAREWGFAPERIDVADPSAEAGHSDNLIAHAAPLRHRGDARLTYGLAAAAAVLALIAVALPFAATQRQAAAMAAEFTALQKQTQAAAALQKELQATHDAEDFLVERKARTPTVSKLLAEVTRMLPDDTWLTEFRLNGTDVELAGVTASASALIDIIEKSGSLRDTSFRSPVTPDAGSGRERFNIGAHILQERQH